MGNSDLRTSLRPALIAGALLYAIVAGCGGGGGSGSGGGGNNQGQSNTDPPLLNQAVSDQRQAEINQQVEAILAALQGGATPASQVAALSAAAGIWQAGLSSDGDGVWWITDEAVACAAHPGLPTPADVAAARDDSDRRQQPVRYDAAIYQPFTEGAPYAGLNEGTLNIAPLLQNSAIPSFDIGFFTGSNADVESLLTTVFGIDLVVVIVTGGGAMFQPSNGAEPWSGFAAGSTNGAGVACMLTGQRVDSGDAFERRLLRAGGLVNINGLFAFTPKLIRDAGMLAGYPFVYLGGHRSFETLQWTEALLAVEASAVYGYATYVPGTPPVQVGNAVVRELILGRTAGDAFDATPNAGRAIALAGDRDARLFTQSAQAVPNGGFEDELAFWRSVPDPFGDALDAISAPQAEAGLLGQSAPEGGLMAILTNGAADGRSSLTRSLQIPANARSLRLRYNLGGRMDTPAAMANRFEVLIGGQVTELGRLPGLELPIPSSEVGDGVGFTGWQETELDLGPLAGQMVDLTLQVGDQRDFRAWMLVDDLRFMVIDQGGGEPVG